MIDFLFLDKGKCYWCKKDEIYKYHLCENCLSKLDYMASEYDLDGNLCYSIYFYNDFMKRLIWDYKFNRNTSLYIVFSEMIYDFIIENNLSGFDYILGSPSSKQTIKNRGFDHIRLIVDDVATKLNTAYLDDFKKVKNTKAQHTLDRIERKKNLSGAFCIEKDLSGKRILLVDDLITTGNTCLEIIKELKDKGARETISLSIATERGKRNWWNLWAY